MMVTRRKVVAEGGIPRKLDGATLHHFRGSLGRFATGVAIVTFDGVSRRHGITVNSFTSVSMDPPLVLVSIARSTKAHDELKDRPFTVNILGAEQQALAMHFAGRPGATPSGSRAKPHRGFPASWPFSHARPGPPTTAATTPSTWAWSMNSTTARAMPSRSRTVPSPPSPKASWASKSFCEAICLPAGANRHRPSPEHQ